MSERRRCHSTQMVTTVPAAWHDNGTSAFQSPDFAQTGLAAVISRGPLSGPIDAFVERELEELRRSHVGFALVDRRRIELAGRGVERIDVRWEDTTGPFVQHLALGSVDPRRWYKLIVSARAAHAAAASALFDRIVATATPHRENA